MQCLRRKGNCISRDMIARIETTQTQVAERCIKSSQSLSIQPKSLDAVVPVIFW